MRSAADVSIIYVFPLSKDANSQHWQQMHSISIESKRVSRALSTQDGGVEITPFGLLDGDAARRLDGCFIIWLCWCSIWAMGADLSHHSPGHDLQQQQRVSDTCCEEHLRMQAKAKAVEHRG